MSGVSIQVFIQQNVDCQCLKGGANSTSAPTWERQHTMKATLKSRFPKAKIFTSGFHTSLFPEWVPQLQNMNLTPSLLMPAKRRDPFPALSHLHPPTELTIPTCSFSFDFVLFPKLPLPFQPPCLAQPGLLSFIVLNE